MLLLYTVTLSLCLLLKLNDDDDEEYVENICTYNSKKYRRRPSVQHN